MYETPQKNPTRALITGGARRIGLAIAEDLAAHGVEVVLHANRSAAAAEAHAADLAARHGVRTAVVIRDLADAASVATLLPAAREALGPLSLLVNNASVFGKDEVDTLTSETFRHHMAVNAEAPAILARDFAAQAPAGGLVVNIIDQRVFKPSPLFLSYAASKATLWWLTRTLAQALAPSVRVNALGPGPTLKAARQTDADFNALLAAVPLERGPDPAEFGAAIRFLAETPSVTGQMLALDGGQHLAWQTPDVLIPE